MSVFISPQVVQTHAQESPVGCGAMGLVPSDCGQPHVSQLLESFSLDGSFLRSPQRQERASSSEAVRDFQQVLGVTWGEVLIRWVPSSPFLDAAHLHGMG